MYIIVYIIYVRSIGLRRMIHKLFASHVRIYIFIKSLFAGPYKIYTFNILLLLAILHTQHRLYNYIYTSSREKGFAILYKYLTT